MSTVPEQDTTALRSPPLLGCWYAGAVSSDLAPGTLKGVVLLSTPILLCRTKDGRVSAMLDLCPHRGMLLSFGRLDGDRVECPYHGWQFSSGGQCVKVPAVPDFTPPASQRVQAFEVQEAFGLIWVRLESSDSQLPVFAAETDEHLRKVAIPAAEKALGIKINLETINANDLQARTTAGIQSKSGPDLIMAFNSNPQLYVESLIDVSDLCESVNSAQGGYYDMARGNCHDGRKWVSVPYAIIGGMIAKVGSTVFDASVTSHLQRIRQRLDASI